MSVSSSTSRIVYAGNNSLVTAYAVPFYFEDNAHLNAIAKTAAGVETVVTLTNHTGAGNENGGTVRTAVAVPATSTLTIYREVPFTQATSYEENDAFPAASHERALDKLTTIAQQLERRITNCIRGTEATPLAPIPSPTGTQQFVLSAASNQPPSWQELPALAAGPVVATGSTQARFISDRFADVVNVKDFGAVGDGVADDTAAIQAALNFFRTKTNSVINQNGCVKLTLAGGAYKITSSLDATGISTWGWVIEGGTLLGHCTGKAVLDLTASRGGSVSNLVVSGSSVNEPRVGIQSARATGSGQSAFCDNMYFENVSVNGYFSLAAVYFYGQETTTHINCQYWNYDENGYAGIHSGYNWEPYLSDYATPITGGTSYINDKYINCDWRYLPTEKSATVSGISNANPCVISVASHPFSVGDTVVIGLVSGMTQINNTKATISATTATSITLSGVNSTAFGVYSSGGSVIKAQTKPTVLFGRAEQHSFDTCYFVNYGTDSIEWRFESGLSVATLITIDALFEGIGSRSHIRYTTGVPVVTPSIVGLDFKTYNTHCRDSVFSTDSNAGEAIAFYNSQIIVTNNSYGTPAFVDTVTEYAFYGCAVLLPARSSFSPSPSMPFVGAYTAIDDGKQISYNGSTAYDLDGAFTPVVSSSAGLITAYTATGQCKRVGELVYVQIDVSISNNGTGSGVINISGLPYSSQFISVINGRENVISGNSLQGFISAGSSSVTVRTYNNAYPASTGARMIISGTYSTAS